MLHGSAVLWGCVTINIDTNSNSKFEKGIPAKKQIYNSFAVLTQLFVKLICWLIRFLAKLIFSFNSYPSLIELTYYKVSLPYVHTHLCMLCSITLMKKSYTHNHKALCLNQTSLQWTEISVSSRAALRFPRAFKISNLKYQISTSTSTLLHWQIRMELSFCCTTRKFVVVW